MNHVLLAAEVAAELGKSEEEVLALCREGLGREFGGVWVVARSELEQYRQANRVPKGKAKVLTLSEAAHAFDFSESWIRTLCLEGRMGRNLGIWLLDRAEVRRYKQTRQPPGRPPGSGVREEQKS